MLLGGQLLLQLLAHFLDHAEQLQLGLLPNTTLNGQLFLKLDQLTLDLLGEDPHTFFAVSPLVLQFLSDEIELVAG